MSVKQKKIKKLKIAIPKGRVLEDSLYLLRKAGFIKHPDSDYNSRKLIFEYEEDDVSLFIVKPWDVPTFVEYGASDAGISGKDVLLEKPKNIYEPLDLGIGKCRIVAAVSRDLIKNSNAHSSNKSGDFIDIDDIIKKKLYYSKTNLRVATKYVRITRDFFIKKGVPNVQIIKLYGNIELAPLSGLCDFIVDLVSTGETLKQNNLVAIEDITAVTSRLIVNRASLKINSESIALLINKLRQQVEKNADI